MKILLLVALILPINLLAQSELTAKDSADYYLFQSKLDSAVIYFRQIKPEDQTPNTLFYKALCELSDTSADSERFAMVDFTACINRVRYNKKKLNEIVIAEELRTTHLQHSEFPLNELATTKYRDAFCWRALLKFDLKDYYGSIADIKLYHQSLGGLHTAKSYWIYGKALACTKQFKSAIICFEDLLPKLSSTSGDPRELTIIKESYYFKGLCELSLNLKRKGYEDLSKSSELGYERATQEIQNLSQQ
jgi:hypothetical protein